MKNSFIHRLSVTFNQSFSPDCNWSIHIKRIQFQFSHFSQCWWNWIKWILILYRRHFSSAVLLKVQSFNVKLHYFIFLVFIVFFSSTPSQFQIEFWNISVLLWKHLRSHIYSTQSPLTPHTLRILKHHEHSYSAVKREVNG